MTEHRIDEQQIKAVAEAIAKASGINDWFKAADEYEAEAKAAIAAMQVCEMTVDEASAIFVDGFSGLLARWDTKTQKAYGDGLALALAKLGTIRIVGAGND